MRFLGSKRRFAKDILPIVLEGRTTELYVEPFVGGANTLSEVSGPRLAADIDPDLVCLWKAVSDGWMPPPEVQEAEYRRLKHTPPTPLKGYAAFALSFGGRKFEGWSRDAQGSRYDERAYRSATKQFPKLHGCDFRLSSYEDLVIPDGSFVYCDPPYRGAKGYARKFDSDAFWEWCRATSSRTRLFVSEYSAPEDFVCVWERQVLVGLDSLRVVGKSATERLFTRII